MPAYSQEPPAEFNIENNSFGVIKDKSEQLVMFIQNNEAQAIYKIVFNEIVLGEGSIDVRGKQKVIPFGDIKITILAVAGNELKISIK